MKWNFELATASLLSLTIIVSSLATFVYLNSPYAVAVPYFELTFMSLLLSPILGLVVGRGGRLVAAVTALHLGAAAGALAILTMVGSFSSRLGLSELLGLSLILFVVFCEAPALAFNVRRSGGLLRPKQVLGSVLGFACSLIGGFALGTALWSATLPNQIIRAAENLAGGYPYCLQTRNGTPRHISELEGLKILTADGGRVSPNFHVLLVIEAEGGQRYANWSFRRAVFKNVDKVVLHSLRSQLVCLPQDALGERLRRGGSKGAPL
ncbi:hypothetical protein [Teichococcus vastitatis]|uniref:Uncharacterized protein n=1 Tax=Teichococcus vastitatis TaxID=2307076 RepID=A0ABS9WBA7_9PROT|nr:hypothetical protein [Pseudoroseomonas vastitatis]MCI0756508.1 hypothetical protein [Pseudoroseomonas vastitatis]